MIFTNISGALTALEKRLEKIGTEYICTSLFLLCGISLVFFTPPLQVPDEPNHLIRAYQISEGILSPPTYQNENGQTFFFGEVPHSFWALFPFTERDDSYIHLHKSSLSFIYSLLNIPLAPDNLELFEIPNTGQYSPLAYLPQALGAWLGRHLDFSMGGVFYMMRLLAVLTVAVCIFISIRILQKKRLLIFVLAMMPMFLYESASLSADAITFALSMLITSYLISLAQKTSTLTKKDFIFLIASAVVLGLLKQVYGILLFLYFLLPHKAVGSKCKFYLTGLVLIAVFSFISMWWLSFMYSGDSPQIAVNSGSDPIAQSAIIKEAPFHYLAIYFSTLQSNLISSYYPQFIGVLGWLTVHLSPWFYMLYFILLVIASICGNLKFSFTQRILILLGTATTVSVIFLNQYITWSPLGSPTIEGVQGRYFIPLAMMFLAAFSCQKPLKYENIIGCTAGLLSATVTILSIWEHFYYLNP